MKNQENYAGMLWDAAATYGNHLASTSAVQAAIGQKMSELMGPTLTQMFRTLIDRKDFKGHHAAEDVAQYEREFVIEVKTHEYGIGRLTGSMDDLCDISQYFRLMAKADLALGKPSENRDVRRWQLAYQAGLQSALVISQDDLRNFILSMAA